MTVTILPVPHFCPSHVIKVDLRLAINSQCDGCDSTRLKQCEIFQTIFFFSTKEMLPMYIKKHRCILLYRLPNSLPLLSIWYTCWKRSTEHKPIVFKQHTHTHIIKRLRSYTKFKRLTNESLFSKWNTKKDINRMFKLPHFYMWVCMQISLWRSF